MLIAFSGLPGTGKTTLARALARELSATYLRIDTIEQAIRSSAPLASDVGSTGYRVAYVLAESNLANGQNVVADSVNPLTLTRAAWHHVAASVRASVIDIEVICSDSAEHRRRVETRTVDIAGLVAPSWAQVQQITYEPWQTRRVIVDTYKRQVAECVAGLTEQLKSIA